MYAKYLLHLFLATTVTLAVAHAQPVLTNGLVAYYPFNGNANDESGLGDHGVVHNARLTPDRFGNPNSAFAFASASLSAIITQGRSLPTGSAPRTFSLWFRAAPKYPPASNFLKATMFEHGQWISPALNGYFMGSFLYQGVPNLVSLYIETPADNWGAWKWNWDFAQWHQAVWVVPATNAQSRLYLDGVNQNFDDRPITNLVLNTVSNAFWIGYGDGNYFDGDLDEVRIYNRDLSETEVQQLYAAEAPSATGSPAILVQPQPQTAPVGGEAVFTVTANGARPMSLQWRFGATNISGATNAVLRLTNVQASVEGFYSVVLSNAVGSVTSSVARLTVVAPIIGGPAPTNGLIAYYPFNGNANDASGNGAHGSNYNARPTVDRFGVANQAFYFNSTNLSGVVAQVPGLPTNGAPRTVSLWYRSDWRTATPSRTGYPFGYGGSPSTAGWFGLRVSSFDWIWTTLWQGQWTGNVMPTSDGQWHQAVLVVQSNYPALYVDGVMRNWISFPAVGTVINSGGSPLQIGSYGGDFFDGALDEVRVYDRALSLAEVLQLHAAEAPSHSGSPVVSIQPADQTVPLAGAAQFSVAADGLPPIRYQWCFEGKALTAATNAVLQLQNVQLANEGNYSVVLSNSVGTVTSSVARLTVLVPIAGGPAPTNGLVAFYPFSGNANDASGNGAHGSNYNAVLSTDRFGVANQAYYFNATNLSAIVAQVPGLPTDGAARTISLWYRSDWSAATPGRIGYLFGYGANPVAAGWFGLRASSDDWFTTALWSGQWVGYGMPTADGLWHQVALVVQSNFPALYVDGVLRTWGSFPPVGTVIDSGGSPFQIGSYGSEYFDGVLDEVRIYNRALPPAEVYQLYNAEAPLPPIVVVPPQSVTVAQGSNASFTVSATGAPALSFQWRKDGVSLPNATNSILTLTNVQPPRIGDYSVVVSNPWGSTTSSVASLTIQEVPSALWQGLVAYYPFNGNANDESGFGDNGVVNGATLAVDRFGTSGAAFRFVATNNESITASGASLPRSQTPRTVSFWCRPQRQNNYSAGLMLPPQIQYAPLGWGNVAASGADCSLLLNNWNGVRAGYFAATSTAWNYDFLPLDEVWHHLIFAYAGGSNLICYVDGRTAGLGNLSPIAQWNTGAGELSLGRFGAWSFDGDIDDVRIYNRALTGAQALELYAQESAQNPRITNVAPATVNVRQSATLSVAATGGQPASFQWYDRYNNLIPAATNNALSFASTGATNLGLYRVVASNAWGLASAAVRLTVNNPYGPVYLPLSKVVPGTEQVSLVPNGDLEAIGSTNAAGMLIPEYWIATAALTLWNSTNRTPANGTFLLAANVTNRNTSAVLSQQIPLEPNTEYVLSGYFWNLGDTSNKVTVSLDASDVSWDPQINLGPDFVGADKGVFVYNKFHSDASGTNIVVRCYYAGLTGNGAAEGYYPLAAQWDNIAVTKASDFAPPQYTAPYITAQPVSRSVAAGTSLQFSVRLTAGEPVFYQWLKDGLPIPTATNRILTIVSATSGDAGLYSLFISNSFGNLTSSNASLVVRTASVPAVVSGPITNSANGHLYYLLQPSSWQEAEGAAVQLGGHLVSMQDQSEEDWVFETFTKIRATSFWLGLYDADPLNNSTNTQQRRSEFVWSSGEPLAYTHWEVNEPNNYQEMGEFCAEIFGQDRGSVVGYWNDTTYYSTGIAEVNPPPVIAAQPQSQTAARGSVVSFSPGVSGAWPRTYLWRKGGVDVPGGTNLILTLTNVQMSDAGNYKLIVSNWAGVATSEAAVLTVVEPVTLTSQPQSTSVNQGGNASFTVTATGGGTLHYQWEFNGDPIAGATGSSLTITNAQAADDADYRVVVTNLVSSVTSTNAHLLVVIPPSIITHPASRTNVAGTTASFSVTATGTSPQFRWRKGGSTLTGATNSMLTLPNVTSANVGVYDVVVWNGAGTNTSLPATLTVLVPANIVASPTNQSILVSNSVTFATVASGTAPLRYQWRKGGSPIGGATNDTYSIASVRTNDAGSYDVVVTNEVGAATSAAAVLTVLYPPIILTQPTNTSVLVDGTAVFSVVAIGVPTPGYQWSHQGVAVPGGSSAILKLPEISIADAGLYKVVVTNAYGTATSTGVTLTVIIPLTLAEAVDAPGYLWTTGGNQPWLPQTNVTFDGVDAVVSGQITNYQQTWVETLVNGPGQLNFRWRASSEYGFDRLSFLVDGAELVGISGETGWLPQTQALASGPHKLRWVYAKDGSDSAGLDTGWLDQVGYAPNPGVLQPVYLQSPKLRQRDGLFQFDMIGEPGKTITIESSTNLRNWSPLLTLTNATGSTRFIDSESPTALNRYFRVRTP